MIVIVRMTATGRGARGRSEVAKAPVGARSWVSVAVVGQIVALFAGLLTNLLYARLLPPADIGRLGLVSALAGLAMVVGEFGLHNWLTRALAANDLSLAAACLLIIGAVPLVTAGIGTMVGLICATSTIGKSMNLSASQFSLIPELAVSLSLYQAALTLTQGTGAFRLRAFTMLANGVLTAICTAVILRTRQSVDAAVHATV